MESSKTVVGSPELHACITTLLPFLQFFLKRPTRQFDLIGRNITVLFLATSCWLRFRTTGVRNEKRDGFMTTVRAFTRKFEEMVQVVTDEESLVCNKGMQEAIADGCRTRTLQCL
jgi:hypothetical protein